MKPALPTLLLTSTLALTACDSDPQGPRSQLALNVNEVTMAGPGCFVELSVSGVAQADFRGFRTDNPEVLGPVTVNARTGTLGWMYEGIIGRTPGTTQVIVTDARGGADTARVRVENVLPQIAFRNDTTRIAAGDSTHLPVAVNGPCNPTLHPYTQLALVRDTSRVNVYSSDPSVLAVSMHPTAHRLKVMALTPGTVRVITKFFGGADTATVVVQ